MSKQGRIVIINKRFIFIVNSMLMKRAFLALLCLFSPALAQEKTDKLRELEKLRIEIEQSAQETAKIETQVRALGDDHAKLLTAALETGEKARAYEGKLAQTELALLMLETNERGIRRSLHKRQDQIGDILSALQRLGLKPQPALLTTPDDTMSAVRSSVLLASVLPDMKRDAEGLLAELNELRDVARKSAAERDLWIKDMTALHNERTKLEAIADARKFMLNRAEKGLNEAKTKADALAKSAVNIEQFLKSLEPLPPKFPPTSRLQTSYPFKDMIGKVKFPAIGKIAKHYGVIDEIGLLSKGITLQTAQKAVITSPSDAQVAYAGPFRSYKQFIILNAGDGYHIIIAGAEKISVETGQYVVSGEPIAMMGETSNLPSTVEDKQALPSLYMEFRKDNLPFNPQKWMVAETK
jgi:murein hydrolase activator